MMASQTTASNSNDAANPGGASADISQAAGNSFSPAAVTSTSALTSSGNAQNNAGVNPGPHVGPSNGTGTAAATAAPQNNDSFDDAPIQPPKKVVIPLDVQLAMIPRAYLRIHEREQREEQKLLQRRRKPRLVQDPQPTAEEIQALGIKVNDTYYTMPPPPRKIRMQQRQPTAAEAAALGPDYKKEWSKRVFVYDANHGEEGSEDDEDEGRKGKGKAPKKPLRRDSTEQIPDEDISQTPGAGPSRIGGRPRPLAAESTEVAIYEDIYSQPMEDVKETPFVPAETKPVASLASTSICETYPQPAPRGLKREFIANDEDFEAKPTPSTSCPDSQNASSANLNGTPKASLVLPVEPLAPRVKRQLRSAVSSPTLRRDVTVKEEPGQPPRKRARTQRVVPPSDRVLRSRGAVVGTTTSQTRSSRKTTTSATTMSAPAAISVQISCGPSARKSGGGRVVRAKPKVKESAAAKASGSQQGRKGRAGRRQ